MAAGDHLPVSAFSGGSSEHVELFPDSVRYLDILHVSFVGFENKETLRTHLFNVFFKGAMLLLELKSHNCLFKVVSFVFFLPVYIDLDSFD